MTDNHTPQVDGSSLVDQLFLLKKLSDRFLISLSPPAQVSETMAHPVCLQRDRPQAEAELRKQQHLIEQIAESTSAILYIYDLIEQRNVYVNRQITHVLGYAPAEIQAMGDSFFVNLVHPDDLPDILAKMEQCFRLADGEMIEVEYRMRDVKGNWHWLQGKDRVFNRMPDGTPSQMVGTAIDITDRKQLELSLQASEAKLSQILDSAIAAIVSFRVWDNRDWVYEYWSAGCEALFGYPVEDLLADKTLWLSQVFAEDCETILMPLFEEFFAGHKPTVEYRFHHKDGSMRWISSAYSSQQISENCWIVTAVNQDITQRKQTEQTLSEQAALLDITKDAVLVKDLDNQILFWNRGAEQLYGWSAAEILHQSASDRLYRDGASVRPILEQVVEQGHWSGELVKVTKAGQEVIVDSRWSLMRDVRGQPKSILMVDTDITEKKQLEAQAMRSQRLESLGMIAGGIAHDLNNMLTPVLGIAQLLPMKLPPGDDNTQQLLQVLENSTRRAANLVQQILSFARGGEGQRTPVLIKYILNDLKVILQGILPNSIEFQVTIAPDVGMVRVDTTQIHQVLMNLCINARDAMPNGGMLRLSAVNLEVDENFARMEPKVRVGNYAVITVEDTGMGIAPEVCDRIFEPFFTTKPEGQGTGLGLSVVERILQSHGGFITMSSQVGQGSRFQVYLPRCEPTSLPSTGVTEPPVGKGELILVVDSEVTICDILKTTLETYHYQVLTAQNSFEALALYAQSSQDIRAALMDLDLPQMDGLTLIALFQRINPQVQVIAMNDTPFPTQPAVVPQGAVKCLLSKPFTYQELLNTLSETLRV